MCVKKVVLHVIFLWIVIYQLVRREVTAATLSDRLQIAPYFFHSTFSFYACIVWTVVFTDCAESGEEHTAVNEVVVLTGVLVCFGSEPKSILITAVAFMNLLESRISTFDECQNLSSNHLSNRLLWLHL